MKYAFWGMGLTMFGLFGIIFIVMFESITVNNESEYYVLKEAMEASMLESVDLACFRNSNIEDGATGACNGTIKISEQKFVENFTRRFVASVSGDASQYTLDFYDIVESPPKATVVVTGVTQKYHIFGSKESNSFNITNNLSGIIMAKDWEYIIENDLDEEDFVLDDNDTVTNEDIDEDDVDDDSDSETDENENDVDDTVVNEES